MSNNVSTNMITVEEMAPKDVHVQYGIETSIFEFLWVTRYCLSNYPFNSLTPQINNQLIYNVG